MLKNIFAPVQTWLLSQNRCVGCGMPLKKGARKTQKQQTIITCKCKRVYVYDSAQDKYRRALISET